MEFFTPNSYIEDQKIFSQTVKSYFSDDRLSR